MPVSDCSADHAQHVIHFAVRVPAVEWYFHVSGITMGWLLRFVTTVSEFIMI